MSWDEHWGGGENCQYCRVHDSYSVFLMGPEMLDSSASYKFSELHLDGLPGSTSYSQVTEVNVVLPSQLPSAFLVCKTLKFSMGGADPCTADVTLLITDVVSFFTFCWPSGDREQQAFGICKPEVKTTTSARMICIGTCSCQYLNQFWKTQLHRDLLFAVQLPVIQQIDDPGATFVFETSWWPFIKGWYFNLAYIVSGLKSLHVMLSPLSFSSTWCISWSVTQLICWKRIDNREQPWTRMQFCFLLNHCCYSDLKSV